MKREDAIILSKIYKIQKEHDRDFYPGDIANAQILPKSKCQTKVEELRDKGFLIETVNRGANQYKVSPKGIEQMCAYRDIKLELAM